jgi:hypothetical protein
VVFLNDFLLVGAPGRNGVYVFRRDGDTGNYVPSALLVPSNGGASDFGIRVNGGGNEAMVSDISGGKSYLFAYNNNDNVWREKVIFKMGGEGSVMSERSHLAYVCDNFPWARHFSCSLQNDRKMPSWPSEMAIRT